MSAAGFSAARRLGAWRYVSLGLIVIGLAVTGCQVTVPRHATSQPAVPVEGNGALAEYITNEAHVTVEPAYRAVYILWTGGQVYEGDFPSLADKLAENRIVDRHWNYPPDGIIDRASVGYMLCRACKVETGLNWHLTGLGRYAWRELNYVGIANPLSEYGYVPGGQFVGMLSRCQEYMRRRAKNPGEHIELGPEP